MRSSTLEIKSIKVNFQRIAKNAIGKVTKQQRFDRQIILVLLCALFVSSGSSGAEDYLYDETGRLTRVTYSDGSLAYKYDPNGNLLRRYQFITPPNDAVCSGSVVNISGRMFSENLTCSASDSLIATSSQVNAGIEVIFSAPTHELRNGFRVKLGSLFRMQSQP
jgi:YD repeat-containing protein